MSADERGSPGQFCDGSQHCITCSDEGTPMRVEEILGDGIVRCIDDEHRESEVMTGLVGDVAIGDMLLVHAGTALIRIPEPGKEAA